MTRVLTRSMLILLLALPAAAQEETTTATETTAETTATAATDTTSTATSTAEGAEETVEIPASKASYEIRNLFTGILQRHPRELAMLLQLDPTLMDNKEFMSAYPVLAEFVGKHPEIRRNPAFYLAEFQDVRVQRHESALDSILNAFAIAGVFLLITVALGWFIRTLIEQKRWRQLTKTQTEVHTKLLDRFGSSDEILQYIRSEAGTRFLEAAPVAVQPEKAAARTSGAPITRIVWSVQIGVIALVASLGMLMISLRFKGEASEVLFVFGAILFCIGGGFIASAAVSLFLSRRLGLWQGPAAPNDGGTVR